MNTKTLSPEETYNQPYGLRTVYFDSDGLRTKCNNVYAINDEVRTIVSNMEYVMETYGGCGISAPQVGEPLNIFLVNRPRLICINPTILKKFGGVDVKEEGCLSIPRFYIKVPRNRKIELHWYDLQGKSHTQTFKGEAARIAQHEMDHLNGLLIDRFEDE